MNDALFQEFGERFIHKLYPDYQYQGTGLMPEKVATKKGTPDAIITKNDGRKIFIEYTVQSNKPNKSFLNKLKNDIDSCLNENLSKISLDLIDEIILFTSHQISENNRQLLIRHLSTQNGHISLSFYDVDYIAYKLNDYPRLLKDFIKIETFKSLEEIDEFIDKSNSTKLSLPIPLDNLYLNFPNNSIDDGLNILKGSQILIITGGAGSGKTRFALELAKGCEKEGDVCFCVKNSNAGILQDLIMLDRTKSYVIIVDDANRNIGLSEIIESIPEIGNLNIKIVATVRDYAFDDVVQITSKLKAVNQLKIDEVNNDFIKEILNSLGIKNNEWVSRITEIAKGNLRIAIMCASLAIHDNDMNLLVNVEKVYDAYYQGAFNELLNKDNGKKLIATMAIVAFHKALVISDSALFDKINDVFGISPEEFTYSCKELNKREAIDLKFDDVVSITDQNFANYIFYRCFFANKILNLGNLLCHYYTYSQKVFDALYPVLKCFGEKDNFDHFKSAAHDAWESLLIGAQYTLSDRLAFLELFAEIIPLDSIPFIKELISIGFKEASFNHKTIVTILLRFHSSEPEYMAMSLQLLVNLYKKDNSLLKQIISGIEDRWISHAYDYKADYARANNVLSALLKAINEDQELKILFYPTIIKFLAVHHRDHNMLGHSFSIVSYCTVLTDTVKAIRKIVWAWILDNFEFLPVSTLFKTLYNDTWECKETAKKIIEFDLPLLESLIEKASFRDSYENCVALEGLSKRLNRLFNDRVLFNVSERLTNKYYLLDRQIHNLGKHRFEDEFNKRKNIISNLVSDKNLKQLMEFVEDIHHLQQLKGQSEDFIFSFVIESLIENKRDELFSIWSYILTNGYLKWHGRSISIYKTSGMSTDNLLAFINKQADCIRYQMLQDVLFVMDEECIHFTDEEITQIIINCDTLNYKLDAFIGKYSSTPTGLAMLMNACEHRSTLGKRVDLNDEFCIQFLNAFPVQRERIENIYIASIADKEQSFYCPDNHNKTMIKLLELNSKFWVKCCSMIPTFIQSTHIFPQTFIWDLPNYELVIEDVLLYYGQMSYVPYDQQENYESIFHDVKDDKPAEFLEKMIIKYSHNENMIYLVFDIVFGFLGKEKSRFYAIFAQANRDIQVSKTNSIFVDLRR